MGPRLFRLTGVLALLLLTTSEPAAAGTSCEHDSATGTVSMSTDQLVVGLAAPGGVISYQSADSFDDAPSLEAPCGAANTVNTDTIRVTGTSDGGFVALIIDASRGPFAPGMTAEPTGTSEIEIFFEPSVDGYAYVVGTEGPDVLRFGTLGANVNADDDADVMPGGETIALDFIGLGGDDDLAATGGLGTGEVATLSFAAGGGKGSDRLVGGSRNLLLGEAGDDRLIGGDGYDRLMGGRGSDVSSGGSGGDTVISGEGDDLLMGGPGADLLAGGRDSDRCVGGPGRDREEGCERVGR